MSDATVKITYRGLRPNFNKRGQVDYHCLPKPRKGRTVSIGERQDISVRNRQPSVTLPKPPWGGDEDDRST